MLAVQDPFFQKGLDELDADVLKILMRRITQKPWESFNGGRIFITIKSQGETNRGIIAEFKRQICERFESPKGFIDEVLFEKELV